MIRSMTGYSSVRESVNDAQLSIEIKTLNNKSFDFYYNTPRLISALESVIRDHIRSKIPRGRVEINIRGKDLFLSEETIKADVNVAKQYYEAARHISQELKIDYSPQAGSFLTLNGVMEVEEVPASLDESWERLRVFVDKALADVITMKEREGQALYNELENLLKQIATLRDEILELRPVVLEEQRQKMIDRIQEWNDKIQFDENRMLQEVAFYSDRSDIQEELVRLKGHVEQFRVALLENGNPAEYTPIGRRLDFICQEMFREVNTIGSKSSSMEISKRVVSLKTTVEQLREQVQNVE